MCMWRHKVGFMCVLLVGELYEATRQHKGAKVRVAISEKIFSKISKCKAHAVV